MPGHARGLIWRAPAIIIVGSAPGVASYAGVVDRYKLLESSNLRLAHPAAGQTRQAQRMAFKKWTRSEDQLRPDARYGSKLVSKFINCMMYDGKKAVATRVFYNAMEIISKKMKDVKP